MEEVVVYSLSVNNDKSICMYDVCPETSVIVGLILLTIL